MYKVSKKASYSAWKRMVIRKRNHGQITRKHAEEMLRVSRAEVFHLVKEQLGEGRGVLTLGGFSYKQDVDTLVITNAAFDTDKRWRCLQEMVMWLKSTVSRSFYSRVEMQTSEWDNQAIKILHQHRFTASPVSVRPFTDESGNHVTCFYEWSWEVDDRQVPAMR